MEIQKQNFDDILSRQKILFPYYVCVKVKGASS